MRSAPRSCWSTAWSTWWCSGASCARCSVGCCGCMAVWGAVDATAKGSVDAPGSAWERVQLARHPQRPYTLDYVRVAFADFIELHGDRQFGDDAAIVGGPALLDGRTVMLIGHQKGRDTRENVLRRFGMARP